MKNEHIDEIDEDEEEDDIMILCWHWRKGYTQTERVHNRVHCHPKSHPQYNYSSIHRRT